MRVFISGPMTGLPFLGFPFFDAKRDALRELGHIPVSPADLDRAVGFDPVDESEDATEDRDFLRAAIQRDVDAILGCDAIVMLDGWEASKGARAELAVAQWFDLRVFYPKDTIPTALRVVVEEAA